MMAVEKFSFTSSAHRCISQLQPFSKSLGHNIPNSFHVFCLCISNSNAIFKNFLDSRGFKIEEASLIPLIKRYAKKHPDLFNQKADPTTIPKSISKLIEGAEALSKKYGHAYIGTEHLIYKFLEHNEETCEFLFENDIDTEHLKLSILAFISNESSSLSSKKEEREHSCDADDDEEEEKEIDFLGKYCTLLNKVVTSPSYGTISGREKEISLMEEVLCRKTKSNCILIGEAGTGKTTVVEGLAQLISNPNYSGPLLNKKVYSLDIGLLIAGTKFRGQFEERFSHVLSKFKKSTDCILFIDEIHTIIGAGSKAGSQDLANMLKPALARGEIKCIGATTSSEYKKYFEKDAALSRRFHAIEISEPNADHVLKMVLPTLKSYEDHHKIIFPKNIAKLIVSLCEIYLPHQRFPDKAFDVVDQSASKTRINSKEKFPKVSCDDVYSVIADKAKVDIDTIRQSHRKSFSSFSENIEKSVFGQTENIKKIYDVLSCAKAGLQNKSRPIASFFFVGPTSVGKTFTAKQIAKEFYGNDKSFLQLNMSEYQEQASISKLIGASAGYVGYEEGGILTEFVRKNPNSLILFDEAEKCNPNVLYLLLQILDEARLNDNLHRSIDFSRCIVVLTGNIGSKSALSTDIGFVPSSETQSEKFESSVKKMMPPEFISRIDEIVIFDNLNKESIINIFKSKTLEIVDCLKNQGISFIPLFSPEDLFNLNKNSEDHAREVKKTIRNYVEVPLAKFIVQNPKKTKISAKILDGKVNLE
jgi:ATP-dependent Clp protease ATP-binding subunit ClpA